MSAGDLERGVSEGSRAFQARPDSGSTASNKVDDSSNRYDGNELHIFQCLVGICFLEKGGTPKPESERPPKPASAVQDIFIPSKAANARFRNRGLYDRALSLDMKNRVMYALTHYVISGLYILQILLTATFTAISGEERTSRTALTVLGAISTVVAGMLAWLTGQGMPIRFRRARDQYREVVRMIEKSERMFAVMNELEWPPGKRPDPILEHQRLGKLFDEARQDQEANYPETHQSPNQGANAQKHDELLEEAVKAKEQKVEMENQVAALQKELEILRGPPKASSANSGLSGKTSAPYRDLDV